MSNIRIITLLAAGAAIFASPALASPTINFSIQTNQFATPTMEFKHQGGKYVWDQKAISTAFSASANTNNNGLRFYGDLYIKSHGPDGSASFTGHVPENVKTWSLQGPITFPVNFLKTYQSNFASYCESHGGSAKVVKSGLTILFSALQEYGDKLSGQNVPEVQEGAGSNPGPFASRSVTMPVTVVCGPKAKPAAPKVSLLQLKLYTIPARPVCGKPVVVMAEFFLNYPGPYNFKYFRDNGDHQNATVTAASAVPAGQNFYMQRWSKTYTFTKTENRKYRIVPQGSPLTTDWVDVSVHCTGGIKTPQANTGNAPKQGAFKPVIAPAKIKTVRPVIAPATLKPKAQSNAPRPFRHIGKAASN